MSGKNFCTPTHAEVAAVLVFEGGAVAGQVLAQHLAAQQDGIASRAASKHSKPDDVDVCEDDN